MTSVGLYPSISDFQSIIIIVRCSVAKEELYLCIRSRIGSRNHLQGIKSFHVLKILQTPNNFFEWNRTILGITKPLIIWLNCLQEFQKNIQDDSKSSQEFQSADE